MRNTATAHSDQPQPRAQGARTAYITSTGSYLPGDPVDNDTMEARLGLVADTPSRYRQTILRHNGINSRYYAIDADGEQTALNQDLAAEAILDCVRRSSVDISEVEMLSLGTTIPDLVMPGFASMVQGRLAELDPETPAMEVLSAAGICGSGAAALKAAWANVVAGSYDHVVAGASELASVMMRGRRFEHESEVAADRDLPVGFQYFNADFLRWMLSDGAGAALVESRPAPDRPSLRIDWIEFRSFANQFSTCMAMGATDPGNPSVGETWLSVKDPAAAHEAGMLLVRQDTDLLADGIDKILSGEVARLVAKGSIDLDQPYDLFLPHLSSFFFTETMENGLRRSGVDIPQDRWFTNLPTVGNVGSASFYLMLDEALRTERITPGDRILSMIPESGRFSVSFAQFTCVAPEGEAA